jgi:lysophospholipase L1-like esterase
MAHIVLLGDSIFDNAAYVRGGPDVVRQLRAKLPEGWQASLLAVDGHVTHDVTRQLSRLPAHATHLVVSVGGNDALGASHLLHADVRNVAEAVGMLGEAQADFARSYGAMIEAVAGRRLPFAVCTVYDTPQTSPEQRIIRTALSLFNDVITRAAFDRSAGLIDLRLICDDPADYANPIEPSVQGGEKISDAILAFAQDAAPQASGRSFVIR